MDMQNRINQTVQAALILATKAHIWHLTTRNYAAHVALGDLYNYYHDVADTISEKAQGAGYDPGPITDIYKMNFTSAAKAIAETEAFINKDLTQLYDDACKDIALSWLTNIIDEIKGNLYGILYKLKRLS